MGVQLGCEPEPGENLAGIAEASYVAVSGRVEMAAKGFDPVPVRGRRLGVIMAVVVALGFLGHVSFAIGQGEVEDGRVVAQMIITVGLEEHLVCECAPAFPQQQGEDGAAGLRAGLLPEEQLSAGGQGGGEGQGEGQDGVHVS